MRRAIRIRSIYFVSDCFRLSEGERSFPIKTEFSELLRKFRILRKS